MEYEFEPGLIDKPDTYDIHGLVPPGTVSQLDNEWAAKWYPPKKKSGPTVLEPFKSVAIELAAGEQADFVIAPTESRKFTMSTKGASDTILVLFEEIDGGIIAKDIVPYLGGSHRRTHTGRWPGDGVTAQVDRFVNRHWARPSDRAPGRT